MAMKFSGISDLVPPLGDMECAKVLKITSQVSTVVPSLLIYLRFKPQTNGT